MVINPRFTYHRCERVLTQHLCHGELRANKLGNKHHRGWQAQLDVSLKTSSPLKRWPCCSICSACGKLTFAAADLRNSW